MTIIIKYVHRHDKAAAHTCTKVFAGNTRLRHLTSDMKTNPRPVTKNDQITVIWGHAPQDR